MEVRADLVGAVSLESVALGAAGLEETSTLSSVAYTSRRGQPRTAQDATNVVPAA